MTFQIPLNLTEEQHHVLTKQAASERRTLSNLLGLLICEGFSYHSEEIPVFVKKREQNLEPPYSYYSDAEIEAVLATLPFQGES